MDKRLIYTDYELTKFMREGRHSAFREIYERYWAVLYMHAYKMLRDEDAAMDIIQDIFMDLWEKRESLEIHTSLKSYLYQSVRYRMLDIWRKSSQHDKFLSSMTAFLTESQHITDEEVNLREFIRRMEAEVARLSPRMRQIFERSRLEGKSHKVIAQELAITDHTVKKTLNRVLHLLRSKLTMLF